MRYFVWLSLLVAMVGHAQAPPRLGYQGRLLRASGAPETGVQAFTFSVFAGPVGGSALWSESQMLALSDGYYATFLGDTSDGGFPIAVLDGTERWLELSVGGAPLLPRQRIASVAYAMRAAEAGGVTGPVDATQVRVGGTTVINASGALTGPAAYQAGAGLSLSGTTFSIAAGGVTNAMLASSGVTVTAGAGLTGGGAVALGGSVTLNNAGVTSLASGGGVTVSATTGAVTLGASPGGDLSGTLDNAMVRRINGVPVASVLPSDGQVLRFNATAVPPQWAPATPANGTVTTVSASAPLSVANATTTPSISMSQAGAGADGWLSAASFNLFNGKLADVSHDGTLTGNGTSGSPLGVSVPVTVASGGTGTTSAPSAAGQYLRSTGVSAYAPGAIQASDLPAGSGSYVQNQSASAQVASFRISGSGSVGGALTAAGVARNGAPFASEYVIGGQLFNNGGPLVDLTIRDGSAGILELDLFIVDGNNWGPGPYNAYAVHGHWSYAKVGQVRSNTQSSGLSITLVRSVVDQGCTISAGSVAEALLASSLTQATFRLSVNGLCGPNFFIVSGRLTHRYGGSSDFLSVSGVTANGYTTTVSRVAP